VKAILAHSTVTSHTADRAAQTTATLDTITAREWADSAAYRATLLNEATDPAEIAEHAQWAGLFAGAAISRGATAEDFVAARAVYGRGTR
jgi:hypothetical protein